MEVNWCQCEKIATQILRQIYDARILSALIRRNSLKKTAGEIHWPSKWLNVLNFNKQTDYYTECDREARSPTVRRKMKLFLRERLNFLCDHTSRNSKSFLHLRANRHFHEYLHTSIEYYGFLKNTKFFVVIPSLEIVLSPHFIHVGPFKLLC